MPWRFSISRHQLAITFFQYTPTRTRLKKIVSRKNPTIQSWTRLDAFSTTREWTCATGVKRSITSCIPKTEVRQKHLAARLPSKQFMVGSQILSTYVRLAAPRTHSLTSQSGPSWSLEQSSVCFWDMQPRERAVDYKTARLVKCLSVDRSSSLKTASWDKTPTFPSKQLEFLTWWPKLTRQIYSSATRCLLKIRQPSRLFMKIDQAKHLIKSHH